jgi:hypothetical protein
MTLSAHLRRMGFWALTTIWLAVALLVGASRSMGPTQTRVRRPRHNSAWFLPDVEAILELDGQGFRLRVCNPVHGASKTVFLEGEL